jgi:hypothetical protein
MVKVAETTTCNCSETITFVRSWFVLFDFVSIGFSRIKVEAHQKFSRDIILSKVFESRVLSLELFKQLQ